jgi:hypothetical protein
MALMNDRRNPKRITAQKMEKFRFYRNVEGKGATGYAPPEAIAMKITAVTKLMLKILAHLQVLLVRLVQ